MWLLVLYILIVNPDVYNIVAILTMKQIRNRVPMLYYWTVWEQKGLCQETWCHWLGIDVTSKVLDPTNNTGMVLTTTGYLPGPDGNGNRHWHQGQMACVSCFLGASTGWFRGRHKPEVVFWLLWAVYLIHKGWLQGTGLQRSDLPLLFLDSILRSSNIFPGMSLDCKLS